ncbi:MAG: IS200/IS605 family transposase [Bacteroidota bacterium]
MGDTYTQCYFQLVFAVRNRNALIKREWKDQLEKYISGIIRNNGHKVLAVGTMPDHIHILLGYNLNQLIPDLVEQIKTSSNAWVKENRLSRFRFGWQNGYGAFTYSRSQIDAVIKYILNQEKHHKKELFREEYLMILKKLEIEYKEEYLFDFFDDVYGWE